MPALNSHDASIFSRIILIGALPADAHPAEEQARTGEGTSGGMPFDHYGNTAPTSKDFEMCT